MTINAINHTMQAGSGGVLEHPVSTPADFFVDSSATDDNGVGSPADPFQQINTAIAACTAGGGEIVEVRAGTYNRAGDLVTPNSFNGATGTLANHNILRAQTHGTVIIESFLGAQGETETDAFWEFHGLWWNDLPSTPKTKSLRRTRCRFWKCVFQNGSLEGNDVNYGAHDWHVYDNCIWFGRGGRKAFLAFTKKHVVLNECYVRYDGGWGMEPGALAPESLIHIYTNDTEQDYDTHLWNCAADNSGRTGKNGTGGPHSDEWSGNWYMGGHACVDTTGVESNGLIAIDCEGSAAKVNDGGQWDSTKIDNLVSLGCGVGFNHSINCNIANGISVEHATIVESTGALADGVTRFVAFGENPEFKNSIVLNCDSAIGSGSFNASYNCASGNNDNSVGTNSYVADPEAEGLTNPGLIDDIGGLNTNGEGGGRIGAHMKFRISQRGLYPDQAGFGVVQTEELWVGGFPFEDYIKSIVSTQLPYLAVDITGLTNFVAGDIGKQLNSSLDGGDIGEISRYDNTLAWVEIVGTHGISETLITTGSTISVTGGTGGGTADGASYWHTKDGQRGWTDPAETRIGGGEQTLTTKVLEYTGNAIPSGIY